MSASGRWKTSVLLVSAIFFGSALAGCQNTTGSRFNYRNDDPLVALPSTDPYGLRSNGGHPQASNQVAPQRARLSDPSLKQAQHVVGAAPGLNPLPGEKNGNGVVHEHPVGPVEVGPVDGGFGPIPTELDPVSHPPYTVAPPDILIITADQLLPRPPYKLTPLDVLTIQVPPGATLPDEPIAGKFIVTPDGTVNLGFSYGNVQVGGLTLREAQSAIRRHLGSILKKGQVIVGLDSFRGVQQISGQHLVRPDGTIHLGTYGSVYVAGMNLHQIKHSVERCLSQHVLDPKISVDVFAYNSKKYYVIYDGGGYGQFVLAFPYTGYETVLDAVSKTNGLPAVSSKKKIWVARPGPAHLQCAQLLPVNWRAITEGGRTNTNYQLMPGDRVFVHADPLVKLDNNIAKILSPIERLLGITLLGSTTVNSVRQTATGGFNNAGVLVPGF